MKNKILIIIALISLVLLIGCNKNQDKIKCYPCIMVYCDEEGNSQRGSGCHLNTDTAKEQYDEWLNDTNCINVTIDYDFLNGEKICYKNGTLT